MRVSFVRRENGPQNLLCDAEVVFDKTEGVLDGLKLVGFALWTGGKGIHITLPSRPFGIGDARQYWDFLRLAEGNPAPLRAFKQFILDAYQKERVT